MQLLSWQHRSSDSRTIAQRHMQSIDVDESRSKYIWVFLVYSYLLIDFWNIIIEFKKKDYRPDGLFLLRKCSASPEDYSLSLICNMTFYHFRISHSIDAYYVLDDGPLIHGIDELIKHYQIEPHGLPCRLATEFVHSMVLPSISRVIGNTNPLHSAAACVCKLTIYLSIWSKRIWKL